MTELPTASSTHLHTWLTNSDLCKVAGVMSLKFPDAQCRVLSDFESTEKPPNWKQEETP
jgi:hypothetical protein